VRAQFGRARAAQIVDLGLDHDQLAGTSVPAFLNLVAG
jgi:hypothetical protein